MHLVREMVTSQSRWYKTVKNQPAMQKAQIQSLGLNNWEDPLEKGMATVHGIAKSWT